MLRLRPNLPPEPGLFTHEEIQEDIAIQNSDRPIRPAIMDDADDIHRRAQSEFAATGQQYRLSADEQYTMDHVLAIKKKYLKERRRSLLTYHPHSSDSDD